MQVNKSARKSCSSELFKSGQTQKVKMRQKRRLFLYFFFPSLTFWQKNKSFPESLYHQNLSLIIRISLLKKKNSQD